MSAATLAPPVEHVDVDPVHAAALAELTSIADQVRYACENLSEANTDTVRRWLAGYGIETKRPYVSTLLSGHRRRRGLDDITETDPTGPADPEAVETPEPDPAPRLDNDPEGVSTAAEPVETPPPAAEMESALLVADPKLVAEPVSTAEPPPVAPVETPAEPGSEPAPTIPTRPIRTGAAVALALSGGLAGGVALAASRGLLYPFAWPWPIALAAVVAALVTVGVLVWSAASVVAALVAGRTGRDLALDVASWTVAGVAGYLAAYGQVKFAEWAGVTDATKYLVPGILEPSVVVLLLLANRRVRRRRAGLPAKPVGKILALAAVLGGFAVYTNVVHAGGRTGLVFGAATVVGLILWWVKLQDDAAPDDWDDQPRSARLSRRTSRYRLLRWLILPGQTRRAWLISLDHSIADAEVGLDLARRWRRAYDESRRIKHSRRDARRAATASIDEYLH
ncbi:hypothetical protein [Actinoplanes sp. TFC3]|uniref:hypothetical protein n=1 Tax=Actinoplanes sp. TFC3 TaxID=1710355 RepID=UPI00082F1938|nr:hypothetical protein [Actinoplanes sp. TFC3]